jgi:glycerophosphoryl diester phosphodiesterase
VPSSLLSRSLIYAHRGGAALRPENTLLAFDHGLSLGADGLELDVHLSRDGVVVVHHDRTLDRTTSARGPLAALTADELGALDAAAHFTPAGSRDTPWRGQGVGVPTFQQVLERYPGVPLLVELKVGAPELIEQIVALIRAAKAVERVALGSFHTGVLKAVRRLEPALRTGASREETRWALYRSWVRWPLRQPAYDEFQVPETSGRTRVVSPQFVAHAHRAGVAVKVWTVDDRADIDRLLDWGVDAIISDRPDVAVEAVKARRGTGATQTRERDPTGERE